MGSRGISRSAQRPANEGRSRRRRARSDSPQVMSLLPRTPTSGGSAPETPRCASASSRAGFARLPCWGRVIPSPDPIPLTPSDLSPSTSLCYLTPCPPNRGKVTQCVVLEGGWSSSFTVDGGSCLNGANCSPRRGWVLQRRAQSSLPRPSGRRVGTPAIQREEAAPPRLLCAAQAQGKSSGENSYDTRRPSANFTPTAPASFFLAIRKLSPSYCIHVEGS